MKLYKSHSCNYLKGKSEMLVTQLCLTLTTPWTIVCQFLLSMGFSRQEYWSCFPCPPPWDFPDPGIKPTSPKSPALQVDSLTSEPPGRGVHRKKHFISKTSFINFITIPQIRSLFCFLLVVCLNKLKIHRVLCRINNNRVSVL